MITNAHTATNIQEIAEGIYRVNTPVELPGVASLEERGAAFCETRVVRAGDPRGHARQRVAWRRRGPAPRARARG